MQKVEVTKVTKPPIVGKPPDATERKLTPVKAIRMKCKDCCCDSVAEIRKCELTSCPLWRYRLGKRPTEDN